MQQWINDPKNKPIVFGGAGFVTVLAIIFILFQFGILGGPGNAPYVPPQNNAPTLGPSSNGPGPSAPVRPAGPPVAAAPPPPAPPISGGASATGRGGLAVVAGRPGAPGPGAAGSLLATATPVAVASAPNARKDPFAPYVDITAYLKRLESNVSGRPKVYQLAPSLTITTYQPPAEVQATEVASNNLGQAGPANAPATAIGRVSGVMLGTGAYAIIEGPNGSSVVQPGDELPGGEGELMSIQSDSITVKSNGQYVKVPISSGDATAGGQGPGQGPGYSPGQGPGYSPGQGPGYTPGQGPGYAPGQGPNLGNGGGQ
jgi:hypothetical protein